MPSQIQAHVPILILLVWAFGYLGLLLSQKGLYWLSATFLFNLLTLTLPTSKWAMTNTPFTFGAFLSVATTNLLLISLIHFKANGNRRLPVFIVSSFNVFVVAVFCTVLLGPASAKEAMITLLKEIDAFVSLVGLFMISVYFFMITPRHSVMKLLPVGFVLYGVVQLFAIDSLIPTLELETWVPYFFSSISKFVILVGAASMLHTAIMGGKLLDESNRTKLFTTQQLTDHLHHEVDTPLASLVLMLEILKDHKNLPAGTVEKLRLALQSAYQVQAIFIAAMNREMMVFATKAAATLGREHELESKSSPNKVLRKSDMSRPVAGSLSEPVNINAIVESARISVFSVTTWSKVICDKDYGGGHHVSCNASELVQVFMNIIQNVLDESYIVNNPIMTLSTRSVLGGDVLKFENLDSESYYIIVRIGDNCGGVASAIQEGVFKDRCSGKPGEGRGRGMFVARNLVLKNGGQIRFENDISDGVARGAVFEVIFPSSDEDGKHRKLYKVRTGRI